MQDSIFTKIIKGEIPSSKVYEDDKTIAILDIHPIQPGHTLVIPKLQMDHLWDLPQEDFDAVMHTSKIVAQRLRKIMGKARVGVQVVGLDVPHAHVYLVPFNTVEEYRYAPEMTAEPDYKALTELAERLRF